LAAFSETVVITVEALIVLILVSYYQKKMDGMTIGMGGIYCVMTAWALLSPQNVEWGPTAEVIACAQIIATVLNGAALLPQLYQNFVRKSSGDYSPVTAALGSGGCSIRLFTTVQLAGGDPLMLLNYGVALLLNLSVLMQVVYFGTMEEKQSLGSLFLADWR
jgi:mannose-P-dolichol utilization defect protein 1